MSICFLSAPLWFLTVLSLRLFLSPFTFSFSPVFLPLRFFLSRLHSFLESPSQWRSLFIRLFLCFSAPWNAQCARLVRDSDSQCNFIRSSNRIVPFFQRFFHFLSPSSFRLIPWQFTRWITFYIRRMKNYLALSEAEKVYFFLCLFTRFGLRSIRLCYFRFFFPTIRRSISRTSTDWKWKVKKTTRKKWFRLTRVAFISCSNPSCILQLHSIFTRPTSTIFAYV